MKSYKALSGVMAACVLATSGVGSVFAQEAHVGTVAVDPAFAGQTSAPLAPKSAAFVVSDFVTGLTRPWAMAHMPDGNMLVTEVPGRLRIVSPDGSVSDPIEGMPAVRPFGSRGLNDVILDPDFEKNRMIYFAYHAAPDGMESDNSDDAFKKSMAEMAEFNKLSREEKAANPFGVWRVSSARLSKDGKSIDSVKTIVDTTPSRMEFDEDGKLLITTQRKSPMGQQDLSGTGGMILRLNKDGSVPKDNPFIGVDGVNPMAYVTGLRNSTGLALNSTSGDFWVADQGGAAGDEVNVIEAGKDYGWPEVSYGLMSAKPDGASMTIKEGTEQPIYYWSPVSMAPSSMMFYNGDKFPGWKGDLFLTGLSSMHLSRLVLSGDHVVGEERLLDEPGHRLRHVSQGADGNIYVIQDMPMPKILKITPKE